jgi:murein L,D-transpeptidase YcbB/YkuD
VRKTRFASFLAGTALVALAISAQATRAETMDGVPVPDTSLPPPITQSDLAPQPAAAADTKQSTAGEAKAPADTQPAAAAAAPADAKPAATAAAPAIDSKPVIDAAKAAVTAPVMAPAGDALLTAKLHDSLGSKLDRIFSRKNERSAVEAFYRDRNFAPLWITDGATNDRAKAAIGYLGSVDRDGLDPTDYPVPDFKSAGDPDSQADAELKLTGAVLTYARHALTGRVAWSRVSADIFYDHKTTEPADILKKLATSTDVAATLDGFEPQFAEYQKLKQALADVRNGKLEKKEPEAKPVEHVKVPEGKILRPGMKDERVVALRKRLDVANKDNPLYDDAVRDAVKTFQASADLTADGNLGPNTVRAMNGDHSAAAAPKLGDPVDTIIVNLDRLRWLPRDLGNTHVVVNIPDYRLTLWKDNSVYWTTKIVAGQPGKPTPLITAQMKFITVNPTWNVPPSIIENEYLPALREDPNALDRIGLKLTQDPDGTVHVSQPPGAGNALGRIRFNFPNKFLVYQHDTPDKQLFAREKRAYSHGCMRVQDPLVYGEKLLSLVLPDEHYTTARLEKMFGGSEININFPESKFIPVHLTYQTAFVDQDGKLQLREDVYGRDRTMIGILKGERKVADIPIERPPNSSGKPVRMEPGLYGGGSRGDGAGNFFQWIFGGPHGTTIRRSDNGGRSVTYR